MDQHETTPQITTKPVCAACAAGYHDEVLNILEQCACPCHGTEVLPENSKSVAIADDCRSIADSTQSLQVTYTESVTRDSWAIADCRRGVER